MKNLFLILFIPFLISNCKGKNVSDLKLGIIDSSSILKARSNETKQHKNDTSIVPESIYLNLDSIKIGNPFTNNEDIYGYYRLLFTSSEETQNFYIEKIKIVGDGLVKLEKRFKIPPQVLGLDHDCPSIEFIRWQTPEIIEINVDSKKIQLDLSKLKVVEIK
jgi:hypothetical protein